MTQNLQPLLMLGFAVASLLPLAWPLAAADGAVLRVAYPSEIVSLDPQAIRETQTIEILGQVMEGLLRFNRKLELEPALAERWEQKSPARWRFYLRKNVSFSNGNPFDADDVVFSFVRGQHPQSPLHSEISRIRSVTRVDRHTIDIESTDPFPLLPRLLPLLLIFDREWVTQNGAIAPYNALRGGPSFLNNHILGTGPFRFETYRRDGVSVLVANTTWWNHNAREHNLARIEIQPIRSDTTRVAALLSGQVDLIFPCPVQLVETVRRTKGLRTFENASFRTLMLGLNHRDTPLADAKPGAPNPLRDLRVRQAILQAIDVRSLVEKIMLGHATVADAILPKNMPLYEKSLDGRLPYDPAAAKRLLQQAGYGQGFSLRFYCPNDRYGNDEALCVAIAAMLAKVGITANLRVQSKVLHSRDIHSGRADLYLHGWAASELLHPYSFLRNLLLTRGPDQGAFNAGAFSDARVDRLEANFVQWTEPQKQKAALTEAFRIHKTQIGHIPLFSLNNLWAAREGVELPLIPVDSVWFRYVRVQPAVRMQ